VSTDGTLPIICLLFCIFHIGIIVPIFVVFVASTGSYDCERESLVKSSILTTLGLNLLTFLHDVMFIVVGCRGGPLEEHKRRHANVLVVTRLILYLLTLAALIFSTVLVYLPGIQISCYAANPCKTSYLKLQLDACVDGELTPPCNAVFNTRVSDIVPCRNLWFNLAATYAMEQYDPSRTPPYPSLPFSEKNDTSLCTVKYEANSEAFYQWQNATGEAYARFNPDISPASLDDNARSLGEGWAQNMGYDGLSSPWTECFSGSYCYNLLYAINDCPVYNDLLFFGYYSSDYHYALVAIWGSWAILFINALIIILVYNAFPEYDDRESWRESVKSMARLMCCSKVLKHAKTEDGEDAAAGLGDLLFKLFGGIDLDYTDLLLGLYLVAERQSWRRFLFAKQCVERHGETFKPRNVMKGKGGEARKLEMRKNLMPDEFVFEDDDVGPMSFRQTVLGTGDIGLEAAETQNEAAETQNEAAETQNEAAETQNEAADTKDGEGGEMKEDHMVQQQPKQAHVMVSYDKRPFLTPYNFSPLGTFEPPVDAKTAVEMYAEAPGDANPRDNKAIVKECIDYLWFAKAAYGLQTKRWKDATHPKWQKNAGDACLSCFGGKAISKAHFTKRNFKAILRYTKINASDILHVSYTHTALGIIPYFVALDRYEDRVIISMRGTVQISDVITDLLGHPKDCSDWMPKWVHERLATMDGAMDEPLQIHSGILSSSMAILRDMEDKGILKALETTIEESTNIEPKYSLDEMVLEREAIDEDAIEALGIEDEVDLPLNRAQSILAEAGKRQLPIVFTGHSLGAAVASVCGIKLRQRFPSLTCACFNPPGGVMSLPISRVSEEICTSIVVGCDVISRMSTANTCRLVDDIVLALGRCKKAKLRILLEILFRRRKHHSNADTYYAPEEIPPEVLEIMQNYIDTSLLHGADARQAQLLTPGKMIYLRPLYSMQDEDAPGWDIVSLDKNALLEEGIILTSDALDHHHLWNTLEAMQVATESDRIKRESGRDV
jgi:hypothetical protein